MKNYLTKSIINIFLFGLTMGLLTMYTFTYTWCYVNVTAAIFASISIPVIMFGLLIAYHRIKDSKAVLKHR